MVRVVIDPQRTRTQLDRLASGVDATVGNIGPFCDERGILKQIVGSAVLLEDDDQVLDLSWGDCHDLCGRIAAAAVQAEHYREGAQE